MNLDEFRLDVDEAFGEAQSRRNETVRRIWRQIARDLKDAGPFSAMLHAFRADATEAMTALVYANSGDAAQIASLQATVQQSLRTMERIDEFQNAAAAVDANTDAIGSDDDDETPPEVEP